MSGAMDKLVEGVASLRARAAAAEGALAAARRDLVAAINAAKEVVDVPDGATAREVLDAVRAEAARRRERAEALAAEVESIVAGAGEVGG